MDDGDLSRKSPFVGTDEACLCRQATIKTSKYNFVQSRCNVIPGLSEFFFLRRLRGLAILR